MPEKLTDEQLAVLAQSDDDTASDELFRRFKDVVRGKANLYFMVGADKDDVNQEGMIGLFKAIRSYRNEGGASFRTYAEHCINNQIISAVERASRLKHEPLNTSLSLHDMTKGEKKIEEVIKDENEMSPEAAILIDEELDHLIKNSDAIFSSLEQEVWLEYLKGKDYNEIAKSLRKTPKAIDNALQRMKKKVQNLFD